MSKVNICISPSQQDNNYTALGDKAPTESFLTRIVVDLIHKELEYDTRFNVAVVPDFSSTDMDNLKSAIKWSNNFINTNGGTGYHLSVHSDGGYAGSGASAFYVSEKGKDFVAPIYDKLAKFTPTSDMGCRKRDNLAELNQTKATAGLIELSFHDKWSEATWIFDNAHTIAKVIADGIYEALEIPRELPFEPSWQDNAFNSMVYEGVIKSPSYWEGKLKQAITVEDAIGLNWAVINYIKRKGGIA